MSDNPPPPGVTTPPWGMPKPKSKTSCLKTGLLGCGVVALAVILVGGLILMFAGPALTRFANKRFERKMRDEAKIVCAGWLREASDKNAEEISVADLKAVVPAPPTGLILAVETAPGSGRFTTIDYAGTSTDAIRVRKGSRFTVELSGYRRETSDDAAIRGQNSPKPGAIVFELPSAEIAAK